MIGKGNIVFSSDDDKRAHVEVRKSKDSTPFNTAMKRDRGVTAPGSGFSPARSNPSDRSPLASGSGGTVLRRQTSHDNIPSKMGRWSLHWSNSGSDTQSPSKKGEGGPAESRPSGQRFTQIFDVSDKLGDSDVNLSYRNGELVLPSGVRLTRKRGGKGHHQYSSNRTHTHMSHRYPLQDWTTGTGSLTSLFPTPRYHHTYASPKFA